MNVSLISEFWRYWILGVLVFVIICIAKKFIVSKIRLFTLGIKLPGPKAWPIFGNFMEFSQHNIDILDKFWKYNQQYGLMRLWFGPYLNVFICTAEDAKIYFTSSDLLDRSEHSEFLKPFLGNGLLTASGHHWKKAKKLMEPAFRYSALKSFLPVFQKKAEILVEVLEKEVGKPAFPVHRYIKNCTLDIITKALGDVEMNAQVQNLRVLENVDVLMTYITNRMHSAWQQNDFIYGLTDTGKDFFRRMKWAKEYLAETIEIEKKSMKERKNFSKEKDGKEILDRLAFLERLVLQKEWTDAELLDHITTMIVAGFETSTCAICFLLVLLGIHQDVQEKLYQEISTAFTVQDGLIDGKELAKLEYLDKVIKESMRIFSIVPIVMRKATADVQFGQHLVPKGAAVGINIFAIHRDPKYYKNPNVFNPENFSKENIANRHPFAFIPFGMGARRCIGEKFAWMTVRIIVTKILLHYKIECDMKMEEIPTRAAITLKMTNGAPIRLLKR